MDFIVSASTDIGIKKTTNQDSLTIKTADTEIGKIAFAVLCDGMGGLAQGEVASAAVVHAFSKWFADRLPELLNSQPEDHIIRQEWEYIIREQNRSISHYGKQNRIHLGTTITAALITEKRYYIINVGDTRAYEIDRSLLQLTKDQTVVAREVEQGLLTPEEAKTDKRGSVLLQCIGALQDVYPDMFFGATKRNSVYMLCTDGFRHKLTEKEIYNAFQAKALKNIQKMKEKSDYLIHINKQREEQDNITVALVRTF